MAETSMSDGACAVFAFAAYHELQSGQPVTKVVIDDKQGHKADPAGVEELSRAGLAKADGDFLVFSEAGLKRLAAVIASLRSTAG
jgi:hypothetical protein